ncbi:hypothetical protein ACLB2K_071747 [Fragaria x ananassa]
MRTTVLSRRWNNQWTSIQNLKFDKDDEYFSTGRNDPDRFARFVNRALHFRESSDIQKFTLCINRIGFRIHLLCGYWHIHDWICTAVRRNVNTADFKFGLQWWDITFDPPASGCFPSLESLKLKVRVRVRIVDPVEHEMEKLLSSCPKLVHLGVSISGFAAFNLKVSAPELKWLKIMSLLQRSQLITFCVDAPKLEDLYLFGLYRLPNLFLENAKSLVRARMCKLSVEEQPSCPNRPNMLLAQISGVKYLSLLARILVKTEGDYESSCSLPEVVPICLSSHLKKIFIRGFKGRKCDMKVAKYLLENGYHLNEFTIICFHTILLDKKEELHKELCMFQKAKSCSIYFDEDVLKGQKA